MPSDSTTPIPTTATPTPDLAHALRGLGLYRIAEQLDDFVAQTTKRRASPRQILEELARLEAQERARKSVERRLGHAHLGRFKPIADFDWNWPKEIDRPAIQRALQLGFLERAENLVLVATEGLGKTMIAQNLAHAAVLAGASALFITAADLLLDLAKQDGARALERRLRHYARPSLLCVDEVGYLAYDNHAADLLFQIVSRRYERRSIVLTTNLVFADWNTVFPNAACATALIDRLTHHAEVLVIKGKSYRIREAELAQEARRRGRRAPS
ncbi:MAG: IS21-like element helper ATPase IstB [Gemmatimonadales bacterium]